MQIDKIDKRQLSLEIMLKSNEMRVVLVFYIMICLGQSNPLMHVTKKKSLFLLDFKKISSPSLLYLLICLKYESFIN